MKKLLFILLLTCFYTDASQLNYEKYIKKHPLLEVSTFDIIYNNRRIRYPISERQPVINNSDGVIYHVGDIENTQRSWGVVAVDHGNDLLTFFYGDFVQDTDLAVGQAIKAGEMIGYTIATGDLYASIFKEGKILNPLLAD